MDKFQIKVLKQNLDSKKNGNINSKNIFESKELNNIMVKNNKRAEVLVKNTRDLKQEQISLENLDLNENGVRKNKINSTNSSLYEYLKLSIEALQMQNERMESMIKHNSEIIDYLGQEQSDLSDNYNFLKTLIETNRSRAKSEITKIDEEIKSIDDEIEDIDKLKTQEETEIFIEISKEIEKMVEKTEQKYVNFNKESKI